MVWLEKKWNGERYRLPGPRFHEKFFETARYSRVRRVLDYQPEPDYADLARAVTEQRDHPLADEFCRYLTRRLIMPYERSTNMKAQSSCESGLT